DTTTSGTSTGVGTDSSSGVTGLTTAQLSGALPSGFSSSIWGNVRNQTTPYILSNPGPVYVGSDAVLSTLVFTITQLQAINSNLPGNYALAQDIDATGVTGFIPIGAFPSAFSGTFNGLGNVIANLVITTANNGETGLFGASSGTIANLGVVGGSV